MKKQGFLLSSAILLITVAVTKVFGLIFKIPLAAMLGGTGMSYFSCAYSIFMPIYAVSVTGLPSAVSKMVSENAALGRYSNIIKIKKVALFSFTVIGIISTALLIVFAKPLTENIVHSKGSYISVLIISPCIYFGTVISVYRGYFEGMRNMIPTAVSEIIEATVKMTCGLFFSYKTMDILANEYERYSTVLGKVCHSESDAMTIILPLVAAASILGVTLSTFACMLCLIVIYQFKKKEISSADICTNPYQQKSTDIFRYLIHLIIPIAISSVITNLTSLIDLGSIIRYIQDAIDKNRTYMIYSYFDVIKTGITIEELPNFIYGSYTGLAITVFNIIPAFTAMFGKSALPQVSEAWTISNKESISRNIHSVLMASMYLGIPAGIGVSFLGEPILSFLYKSRPAEVIVSTKPLAYLGIGIIFLSVSIPVFSLLQAIGRSDLPLKILICGVAIKLVGNYVLIQIPSLNISGAAISTDICYAYIAIMSLYELIKITDIKLHTALIFLPPLLGGLICGLSAKISYNMLYFHLSQKVSLLFSIVIGVIFYILLTILLGIPTKCRKIGLFNKKIS